MSNSSNILFLVSQHEWLHNLSFSKDDPKLLSHAEDSNQEETTEEKDDGEDEGAGKSSLSSMLSQAKMGLGKKKIVLKSAGAPSVVKSPPKSEADQQWEQVEKSTKRPLRIKQVSLCVV